MIVQIRDLQPTPVDHDLLEQAAHLALAEDGGVLDQISVALVDDERIGRVNQQFRGSEGPTDVIAFEAEPEPDQTSGEVIISVQTAARQAAEHGHSLARELCLLMAHGTLHTLGHDDENEAGAHRMHELQDRVLARLGEI